MKNRATKLSFRNKGRLIIIVGEAHTARGTKYTSGKRVIDTTGMTQAESDKAVKDAINELLGRPVD